MAKITMANGVAVEEVAEILEAVEGGLGIEEEAEEAILCPLMPTALVVIQQLLADMGP